MAASFEKILLSRPFKFFIGPNEVTVVVHEEAIASQSTALSALMRGGMSEGQKAEAKWIDIDLETFTRFTQFAYTGDYSAPTMIVRLRGDLTKEPARTVTNARSDPNITNEASGGSKKAKSTVFSSGDGKVRQALQPTIFKISRPYPLLQPRVQFAQTCDTQVLEGTDENISEVLLSHAELYILVEKWGIDTLKALMLFKLHRTLGNFPIMEYNAAHIVELARKGYSGTPDLDDEMDGLRALICQYIAAYAGLMSRNVAFTELVEEGGAFARDMFTCMLARLSLPA